MNVYRSGDSNQRKPILKPLSTGSKKRLDQHPQPSTTPSSSLSSISSRPKPSNDRVSTTAHAEPALPVDEPDSSGAGGAGFFARFDGMFSQRIAVPAWLAVILAFALVAGPTLAILTQWNPGSNDDQQELVAVEPTATPADEVVVEEDLLLALEADPIFDPRQWEEPLKSEVSNREQYLIDQGVNPDLEVRYASDEVERLQAELEAIQRNSAMLRSLARQQSGDLSAAYSSLEATQEHTDGAVEDLQERIDGLEERVQSVDDLARELRDLLGLAPSDSGVGGPMPSDADEEDPWLTLRNDIVHIEQWAGQLVFDLDEVNTEIQLRIARMEQAQAEAEARAQAEAEAEAQAQAQEEAQAQAQVPSSGSSVSESLENYDSMPMGWPVDGPITSRFGGRSSPFAGEGGAAEMHTGIDIAARTGTPVVATGGGTVQVSGNNGGYGLLVVIDHGRGITTWYGHNSRLLVSPGQRVNAGDVIAEVGSTGRSTGPHVHYEVRTNGVPEDPMPYMQMSR